MTEKLGTKKRDYSFLLRIAGVIVACLGAFLLLPSFMTGKYGVPLTWGMTVIGALMIGASYLLAAKRPTDD